jgi:hypothetical protein
MTLTRPARACPGHPRRAEAANFEGLLQRRGVRTNAPHAAPPRTTFEGRDGLWAWMPGTRPGKTRRGANLEELQLNSAPQTVL